MKSLARSDPGDRRRAITDRLMRGLCIGFTALALVPLFALLWYVTARGIDGLSWSFFTDMPVPVGEEGGGMKHAVIGTLVLIGLASSIGVPLGLLAGIYLAELGKGWLAHVVRLSADVMSGVPSIVVGIFVYGLVVLSTHSFSALAGGVALGIIMVPTVTRTTEEMLKLVPDSLREAALALGAPKRRAILRVVLRTAAPGIATGIMLAVARVAGETAPLLFTALGNNYYSTDLDKPIASLPVQIYNYAISPYDDWHKKAWAAALVLLFMVLVLNMGARALVARGRSGSESGGGG